uniref:Uncharacterized protein n=1 Tax=Lactuca sativa TaxID=4236 RepID=A0A9R1WZ65_LACSA|nr:hypothetical protein LSAT_V11C800388650 [Lactuca sativa]
MEESCLPKIPGAPAEPRGAGSEPASALKSRAPRQKALARQRRSQCQDKGYGQAIRIARYKRAHSGALKHQTGEQTGGQGQACIIWRHPFFVTKNEEKTIVSAKSMVSDGGDGVEGIQNNPICFMTPLDDVLPPITATSEPTGEGSSMLTTTPPIA